MLAARFALGRLPLQLTTCKQTCSRVTSKLFSAKYLLATNCVISVAGSYWGDILQQKLWISRGLAQGQDRMRTARMSVAGLMMGVMTHYWYEFLDRRLRGRGFAVVMKKVVVDQAVLSPVMWMCTFALITWLEGADWHRLRQRICTAGYALCVACLVWFTVANLIRYIGVPTAYVVLLRSRGVFIFFASATCPAIYGAECAVWPPAQMVNFYLLPTRYRVFYDNAVSFVFDWFSSYVINDLDDDLPDSSTTSKSIIVDGDTPSTAITTVKRSDHRFHAEPMFSMTY